MGSPERRGVEQVEVEQLLERKRRADGVGCTARVGGSQVRRMSTPYATLPTSQRHRCVHCALPGGLSVQTVTARQSHTNTSTSLAASLSICIFCASCRDSCRPIL